MKDRYPTLREKLPAYPEEEDQSTRPDKARPVHGAYLTACWDGGELVIGRSRFATCTAARKHADEVCLSRHAIVLRVVGEDPDWTTDCPTHTPGCYFDNRCPICHDRVNG